MQNHVIQSLTVKQLSDCLETIHKAFGVNCEKYGLTKENYPSCAAFITLDDLIAAKESGSHVYAIYEGDRVAGCVMLKRTSPDTYAFTRFAVHPECQKLGLGRELVNHCRVKAKEYGAEKMTLLMMYENEALRRFYESCGFTLKETGTDDAHPFVYAVYEMIL